MSTVQKTILNIPTVYAPQQQAIERKRRLAEAMMARGLETNPNMTSWAQPLAQIAQAWAGQHLQKKADKKELELGNTIREDYSNRRGTFLSDAGTMTPKDLVAKYGNDPMLAEELKPYAEAFQAKLKSDQELIKDGDVWQTKGNIQPGQVVRPDMNNSVIHDGQGNYMVNPLKVTAGVAAQGLSTEGYPTAMPMPGVGKVAAAMAGSSPSKGLNEQTGGALLQKGAELGYISPEEATMMQQAFGPRGQQAYQQWMMKNNVKIGKQVGGQTFYQINGQWYDNPEGH